MDDLNKMPHTTNIFTKKVNIGLLAILIMSSMGVSALENGNPLVNHIYTADPSGHVFENRVYIYPSHDEDDAMRYTMKDYHVLSSADLLTWEDHGVALSVDNVPWASQKMWAPDCVYKDGIYYFYFPAKDKDNNFRIGVATSDSPAGPFTAEPNYIQGSDEIDPAVFIDDDGQAYLYWGGKSVKVAKLDASMKKINGEILKLKGVDYFYEAAWMHKYQNTYYLSYSTGKFLPDTNDHLIAYATADSPTGPFSYQGIVNGDVSGITNHHSIVEYKGQWYLFYHNSDLSGGNNTRRSVAADYLHFNDDRSIRPVIQTELGIGRYNGRSTIEAENYSETKNTKKRENLNDDGLHVVFDNNDKIIFNNIDFDNLSFNHVQLKVTSETDTGTVMVRTKTGTLLAEIAIPKTEGIGKWKTVGGKIGPLTGTNDISFSYVDASATDSVFRLDSILFTKDTD